MGIYRDTRTYHKLKLVKFIYLSYLGVCVSPAHTHILRVCDSALRLAEHCVVVLQSFIMDVYIYRVYANTAYTSKLLAAGVVFLCSLVPNEHKEWNGLDAFMIVFLTAYINNHTSNTLHNINNSHVFLVVCCVVVLCIKNSLVEEYVIRITNHWLVPVYWALR